jgi:hypothetical protein
MPSVRKYFQLMLCFKSCNSFKNSKAFVTLVPDKAAANMAKIMEVSLDWLVGNTDTELNTNRQPHSGY